MIKSRRMNLSKRYSIIILLLILVLASFFRLWQIDSMPPGLYPDEAINGNDALKTLETGQFKVFYPENNGREGLFVWLIALSFKLFGPTAGSIRLVSALLGILTVLGLYLLTKELFTPYQNKFGAGHGKKVALLSSFFLAISFWHINFSRIGFRAILVPFLICFSFYFLLRAFRKNTFLDYTWAGIFFGLGFYTYIAFRVAVLILGVVILLKMIDYWSRTRASSVRDKLKKAYLKDGWWKVDIFFIVIIIIVLPLGIYFFNNPQDFIGRAGGVSIFSVEQPFKELAISTIKTLGMFNFVGDWNWRHNYAGWPMLNWTVGILFILGLILTIKNLFTKRNVYIFLLSWFLIMLLPAILTYESIPHALRTIGVIPVVYIFVALGFIWLFDKLAKINKKIAVFLLILLLVYPALANFNKYFLQWAQNSHVAGAFRQDLVDLTNYLNNLPTNIQKIVLVNESGVPVPYPDGLAMPAQTIIFKSNKEIKYLAQDENSQTIINNQPTVIIPLKYDQYLFQQLSKKWPDGKIKQINGFSVYEIQ